MNINLPPIQNFYGNNDFNNWIRNCKPFVPIQKSEISKINWLNEKSFSDEVLSMLKYYNSPILTEANPTIDFIKTTPKAFDGGFSERIEGRAIDIHDFLKNDRMVVDKGILNELLHYSKDKSLEQKVRRIYYKAIRARKIDLSDRIKEKYRKFFVDDDWTMAYCFSALNIKKGNEK